LKALKGIVGTIFALSLIAVCGYLMYMFFFITYLPRTLSILIMVLCGIGIWATIHIWIIFIRSLNPKKHETIDDYNNEKTSGM
jgi:hypothetical protein